MTTRIPIYRCRFCGEWQECADERQRLKFLRKGACAHCLRTQFFRVRCHIVWLEESLERIIQCGRAADQERKVYYRALYYRRSARITFIKNLLQPYTIRGRI